MELAWKVAEGSEVRLADYDPDYTAKNTSHSEAKEELDKLGAELDGLQELMWAAHHHSLLLILQGMDTSGKDGTIRHVFSHVNPQGCAVQAFKVPTEEEASHDFLWRAHKVTPGRGALTIFNRSYYEDVLVVRVHNLVPEEVWTKRYKEIKHFEKLLVDNKTIVLKFFLHISKDEQEQRLLAREKDKDKAWKVAVGDWKERAYWDEYQKAYEVALSKCSTDKAPWYIVPANHKWYRNLAIAHTLVHVLRGYKDEWQADLEKRGRQALAELRQMRKEAHK
ncbi:polyphosphate kinase 2 family protein [Ktedonosporobacter rubrisoli]|uniref:Polyphosphate kinase 2 family protein n=1 Tax=Ktedonosporobacter rubrisoli TaxID=2509675 RepID=A0A4P6JU68_KTERU|nr:PPK2 family polyphosphate kinase [Ktedonosporobacter rubrisoli]QBD78885.1 polyphosphate kinase 2 family protein [Ktedonosporobacter rubrisoli]